MPTYNELTTVAEIRRDYLDIKSNTDDPLLLDLIRDVCADIVDIGKHKFYPRIETRVYDVPMNMRGELFLGDDLLELTTLTNGDGTAIDADDYLLNPANVTPKHSIELVETSGVVWQSSSGNTRQVIQVNGVWGYHNEYASAWRDTLGTLQTPTSINSSVTSMLVQTGKIKAGYLLKMDSEFLYAGAVAEAADNDTVTLVRAVNGSTAAAHLNGVAIYRWDARNLGGLARRASVALYKLRNNPTGETVQIDGQTFVTPRDVTTYLRKQLMELGKVHVGIG